MPSIRNARALCSGDIPLLSGYMSTCSIFGVTSASFSTQGCLIWEGPGIWRRKLLWVSCQHCRWCGCHGRSRECLVDKTEGCFAGETDALFLVWATAEPTQTSLSIALCVLCFLLQTVFVAALSTHTWRGNQWELSTKYLKCCNLAHSFRKLSPECLYFGIHNQQEASDNFDLSLFMEQYHLLSHACYEETFIDFLKLSDLRVRPQGNSVMMFTGLLVENRPAGHTPAQEDKCLV